ncbi:MAG TPA: DUF1152 domain-containing protein [Nitrospirales bacterium]|nr:hypothetical protein [Nitrospiraceae bacterium]HNP31333.1 DUF1152 domain-containing protein [Nitrospirales bacterium]
MNRVELNLPIFDQLAQCKSLLIAGMGGGFDVFCGLPIYFELKRRGHNLHLANLSFADIEGAQHGLRLSKTLVGVTADSRQVYPYFPEFHLARWFKEKHGETITVWCFEKTGAAPLLENYRLLVEYLSIDGILLIDGGVDSLIRGDEAEKGTLIEDATSLFAVHELRQVETRLLACVAMGAEQDITYTHIFENVAELTQTGGFLGACALLSKMESYRNFEEAVLFVQGQPLQDSSVINSSLISAVRGHFGDYHLIEKTKGSPLWISPLMPLYWCFDLDAVAQRNLFLPLLRDTRTFGDALRKVLEVTASISIRLRTRMPL